MYRNESYRAMLKGEQAWGIFCQGLKERDEWIGNEADIMAGARDAMRERRQGQWERMEAQHGAEYVAGYQDAMLNEDTADMPSSAWAYERPQSDNLQYIAGFKAYRKQFAVWANE